MEAWKSWPPEEEHDVASEHAQEFERLGTALDSWTSQIDGGVIEIESLRALGYL